MLLTTLRIYAAYTSSLEKNNPVPLDNLRSLQSLKPFLKAGPMRTTEIETWGLSAVTWILFMERRGLYWCLWVAHYCFFPENVPLTFETPWCNVQACAYKNCSQGAIPSWSIKFGSRWLKLNTTLLKILKHLLWPVQSLCTDQYNSNCWS